MRVGNSLVPSLLFSVLFAVAEKRVRWIFVGCFIQQTLRFWESLIGVDNHKSLLTKCQQQLSFIAVSIIKLIAKEKLCERNPLSLMVILCAFFKNQIYTATLSQKDQSDSVGDLLAHEQITRTYVQCVPTDIQLNWIDLFARVAVYVELI